MNDKYKTLFGDDRRARHGCLGWFGVAVAIGFLALPPTATAELVFTRIIDHEAARHLGTSAGVGWGDYTNDGWVDIYVTNWGNQTNFLMRNVGDDMAWITGDVTVLVTAYSSGVCWADYDNDGFLDLFEANQQNQQNHLFHNNGDGSFSQVGSEGGDIEYSFGSSYSSAWGDYDNDGFPDLFVANSGHPNYLYHNLGDGSFELVTTGPIATDAVPSWGAAWCDYNNDGRLDLFVANTSGQNNSLYRNDGDGSFTSITSGPVVSDGLSAHGGSWADYDNDGDFDLFVANGPYSGSGNPNRLYRNDGGDNFTEMAGSEVALGDSRSGSGTWADFDNDGDVDLFVTNYVQPCDLYENQDGVLVRVISGTIGTQSTYSSGNAAGDYDRDGDQDLLVANWEDQNNILYRAESGDAHWLRIYCAGVASNARGIGARVRVRATIGGQSVSQLRQIDGGQGHRSQNEPVAAFGLGDAPVADSVIIDWPSGVRDVYTGVDVERGYEAVEGSELRCGPGDLDEDGVLDGCDLCHGFDDLADADSDGVPDGCDICPDFDDGADADGDRVPDGCDLCPGFDDGLDIDEDGYPDDCDNCPLDYNPGQSDWEHDGVGDECDNCWGTYNPDQADWDEDGIGDACGDCCQYRVGDVNGMGGDEPTVSDVSVLIDAKFIGGTCEGVVNCMQEGDIDQSGGVWPTCAQITISDISILIDYLFITGTSVGLADCLE